MTSPDHKSPDIPEFDTLSRPDGHLIAYRQHKGDPTKPGVIFCGGFMSNMFGAKAAGLEQFCREQNLNYTRFDYRGHGVSSGLFDEGCIGDWADDALQVFDRLTTGRQIVVGSSMGGWIMLKLHQQRAERIHALVGIAAAPDFTETLFYKEMNEADRNRLQQEKVIDWVAASGANYRLSQRLFDDGIHQQIMNVDQLPIDCSVRLLHGIADTVVPWQTSIEIAEKIRTDNVVVHLVKDGDHSLSRPADLALLCQTVQELTG